MTAENSVPMFKLLQAIDSGTAITESQLQLLYTYKFIVDVDGRIKLSVEGKNYLASISPRLMREPVTRKRATVRDLSDLDATLNTASARAAIYELAKQDDKFRDALFGDSGNRVDDRTLNLMVKVFKRGWAAGRRSGLGYRINKIKSGRN